MHELAIAESVVSSVLERTEDQRVTVVRLRIGRLAGVVPDALSFCFELATAGTPLEGAMLEIVEEELGYCGPAGAEAMLAPDAFEDIERRARLFDGAWSYLELLAAAAGIDDPLDVAVVNAYWVGSDLLDAVDPGVLVMELEERFRGQFGGTWREASNRAAAHHSFQVFEVYPWAGLLREGRPPEPAVNVLNCCRIRVGEVTAVDGERVTVSTQLLAWDGTALDETPPVTETARWSVAGSSLIDAPVVGDTVALHWDWVCEVIGPEQARTIREREARARAGAGLSPVRR